MKQTFLLVCVLLCACGPSGRPGNNGDDDDDSRCPRCTDDKMGVIDCNGNVTACPPELGCSDVVGLESDAPMCMPACEAAENNNSSVGCDYYAVDMDAAMGPPHDACFAVFVANTSLGQAHMNIEFNGSFINLAQFAKIPQGSGQNLTYGPYDPGVGLAPGQVAIVFLAHAPTLSIPPNVSCPVPAAIGTEAQIPGNGIGKAFHITTDMPVVAYQMLPYGGGAAAATGASLLLPTSAWATNYVAVTAYDSAMPPPISFGMGPSMNIVAMENDTVVTMRPKSNIGGGAGIPAGTANQPWTVTLQKGEHAQITQLTPLSGSPIQADKPIGLFGGHQIMSIDRCCGDHGEQMIAPVRALGYEYVAAPHGDRKPVSEERIYRIFGAVDGTALTYDPPNVGPDRVQLGEWHEIRSATPFTVRSQDQDHPFLMFTYMSGAGEQGEGGWGDADFVRMVPPQQYMKHYVFFADPTYPFTVLTVVRKKKDGAFKEVTLKCLGTVTGWQSVGSSGDYEITYVKLVDHFNGQNGCNNGVNTMDSEAPFGVWVWGWGSEDTTTGWVSYGYPAGEGVLPINDVIIL
ncbi:MAG TPA: IgGFc-binding protein [Kofleriaceae bacterium]